MKTNDLISFRRRRCIGRKPALVLAALVLLCSSPAPSDAGVDDRLERLPEAHRKWLEEEVVYIITDRERDAFLDLQSAEEWEAFITAFWRKRDPDTLTEINEFKEEHYRRIAYANRELGRESAVPGWMTDRGKMYIILGEPDDKDSFRSVPGLYPAELWFYLASEDRTLPPLYLLFFQEGHAGPYRLFNHVMDGPEKLMPAVGSTLDMNRLEAYEYLQTISPELAHATITMRADRGAYGNAFDPEVAPLEYMSLLADIYTSPHRRVDTRYVAAAAHARGLVESEYLFNFVPSAGMAAVLPGPNGTRFVHYSVEIEPQHLTLATDGEKWYTTFELSGELTSADGDETVLQFTKERYLTLTESQFLRVRHRPFAYRNMFPIVEGDFHFRLVLKNRARSEYTIFETPIRVPAPGEEGALGEPILLYETAPIASTEPGGELYRTYQIGPLELDPNARRLYAIGDSLAVYVPVGKAAADDVISLRIESIDPRGVVQQATPKKVGEYDAARMMESLSTEGLVAGRYRLVVGLADETGVPIETRDVPFDITPLTNVSRPWALTDSIDGSDGGTVLASLAEQYVTLGEMAKARDTFIRSLEENPGLTGPRVFLAQVALDNDKAEKAIELLEPVLEGIKDDFDALVTLGDAYVRVANYGGASRLFEAAIALRRPDTTLLNSLAACYAKLGNLERARDYLERSLALDPSQEKVEVLLEQLRASNAR